jgi:MerR family transcriptional regulator, thiopeptide resistance regulator
MVRAVEVQTKPHSLTVGAAARLAGVTVRTLHHYDEIGLLVPSDRSDAGYRRYGDDDLERLQRILFYRELGFGLDQIREVMTDGHADASAHLRRQHGMLRDRIRRLERMVAAVEKAMEARTMGIDLTPEERFEVFGEFDPDEHAAEVDQRWGDTDAYRESARRTRGYTKSDWQRIKAEGQAAVEKVLAAMKAGKPANSEEAMDGAEMHRLQIDRNFYPCSYELQVGLAEMYLGDPRFTATYESIAVGLAQYLHDAIKANAARDRS